MDEKNIIKQLKECFKTLDNPVLKFIDYSKNADTIIVKGTVDEWVKFLNEVKK